MFFMRAIAVWMLCKGGGEQPDRADRIGECCYLGVEEFSKARIVHFRL